MMPIDGLSDEAVAALERVSTDEAGVYRQRAQAILLAGQGEALDSIAAKVHLTTRQITYWLRRYQRHGIDIFPNADVSTKDEKVNFIRPNLVPMDAPGVQPDDHMSEAGRKVLAYHFIALLSGEIAIREKINPEAVHDMRVAARRLRSTLDIFGNYYRGKPLKAFQKELRRLARALGTARDLEVVRRHAEDYANAQANSGDLQPLLNSWRDEERDARELLIDIFDSRHYQQFLIDFAEFVTTPGLHAKRHTGLRHGVIERPMLVRHVAQVVIYERSAMLRAYGAVIPEASLDTLHVMRIVGKYLRYALEAFAEVLGPEAKKVIQAIKVLQNHLGALQDARVAADLMRDYVESTDNQVGSISAYIAAREAERQQLQVQVSESWAAFNKPELWRALALSMAPL
jgi:CHAD domain-containing protein